MEKFKKEDFNFLNPFLFLAILASLLAGGIMGMAFFNYQLEEEFQKARVGELFYHRGSIRLLEESDRKEIFDAARAHVSTNGIDEINFDLKLAKRIGDLARLELEFISEEAPAGKMHIILKKMLGQWQVQAVGMDLPEWRQKQPKLFD